MIKRSGKATEITFKLTSEEVKRTIIEKLEDNLQVEGANTVFEFNSDGECVITTMHYGLASSVKEETIELDR